jgi:FAS-associated factor 2
MQNRRNNNNSIGLLQRVLNLVALILRILLWPVQRASSVIFPPGEFDGLEPAVTAKAAEQFVGYLKSLTTSTEQAASVAEAFSTLGFAALREEAVANNSIIVVYLHSPLHDEAKEMCQKLILQSTMLDFLKQPIVRTIGVSVHTSQGAQLAQQLGASSYPLLAMLQPGQRASSGMQLLFKVEGLILAGMQINQLMPYLNATYTRHEVILAEQTARRIEREQEQELRRQQDEEYQATLRADQERERQRQAEREAEEQKRREEEEKERKKQEEEESRLENAKSLIRPEPKSGGTRIRFTLPSGKKLDRRFESDETIASLKAFLTLHFAEDNPEIKNIALSTSFPKKTYDEDDQTLQESGLAPQAVLMVQDLDA